IRDRGQVHRRKRHLCAGGVYPGRGHGEHRHRPDLPQPPAGPPGGGERGERPMTKLVLASKNPKKLVEMNDILSHLGVEVCSEAEAGVDVEVEETGTTFEENSLLKARAVMEASGMPAIA